MKSLFSRLLLFALLASGAGLSAQVPENAVVVATGQVPKLNPGATGKSGLFYVSLPTATSPGGTITTLTGLPSELTVDPNKPGGATSVVRRHRDGTLFVGDMATNGGPIHVHILKMNGAHVTTMRKVVLGQGPAAPNAARPVGGLALLPDGRVLVAAGNLVSGPMAGWKIAILDDRPAVPTLTRIVPAAAMTYPVIFGVAVSPDGSTAYALNHSWAPFSYYPAVLYAVDLTRSDYPVAVLHTWPNHVVTKLAVDRDGAIHAAGGQLPSSNPFNPSIFKIVYDKLKKTVKVTKFDGLTKVALTGIALERANGRFVLVSNSFPNYTKSVDDFSVLTTDSSGKLSVLTGPPAGGWGSPMDVAINDAFEPYGHTRDEQRHWFAEFPNPGGLPEVGNANFSVTMQSNGNPTLSRLLIGLAPTNTMVAGVRLLVEPVVVLGVPKPTYEWKFPIPNHPVYRGLKVYMQGAHYEAGKWGVSRGLEVVIQ